ncbi:MAG: hypothetical protein KDB74_13650 [Flavobacteriales bacterium]|nr:hypothetical protein [Flavobacteriales bacterium]
MFQFKLYKKAIRLGSFLFVVLCLNINTNAQDTIAHNLKILEDFNTDSRSIPHSYLGKNSKGNYFLFSEGKYAQGSTYFIKTNHDFTEILGKIKLTDYIEGNETEQLGYFFSREKVYNFSCTENRTVRKFYYQELNLDSFSVNKKILLDSIHSEKYNIKKSFSAFISNSDTSTLGLIYDYHTRSEDTTKFCIISFDQDLVKVNHHVYSIPKKQRNFIIYSALIHGKNETYLITADESKLNLNYKSIPFDIDYHILKLKDGLIDTIAKIDNQDKWIRQFKFEYYKEKLILTGIYSNHGKFDLHGTFQFQYNLKEDKLTTLKFKPVNPELFRFHQTSKLNRPLRYMYSKNKVIKYQELPLYFLNDVYDFEDGSRLLAAEQRLLINSNVDVYVYGNIFLTMLDSSGNVLWEDIILKNNTKNFTPVYSGYTSIQDSNKIWFVYNDNINNLRNIPLRKRYNAFTPALNSAIILTEVNSKGLIKQEVIYKNLKLRNKLLRPNPSFEIGKNKLLLFSQNKANLKSQKFFILDLNK